MSEEYNENVEVTAVIIEDQGKLEVKIGDWLKAGWELYKTDWLKFSLSVLIVVAVSAITCGVLLAPMLVGLYACCLKKIQGSDFEYGDLFDGIKKQFLPSFLLALAMTIAATVLSVIPCIGSLLSLVFYFIAMPVLVYSFLIMAQASETYKVDALLKLVKDVYLKLKPQYFNFVLFAFVAMLVGGIGGVVCGIGAIFTYPIAILALSVSYTEIFGIKNNENVETESISE